MSSLASAAPATETVWVDDADIMLTDLDDGDSLKNSRPIPEEFHAEISKLAYSLWCQRGCPEGSPEVDWFAAELKRRDAPRCSILHRISGP